MLIGPTLSRLATTAVNHSRTELKQITTKGSSIKKLLYFTSIDTISTQKKKLLFRTNEFLVSVDILFHLKHSEFQKFCLNPNFLRVIITPRNQFKVFHSWEIKTHMVFPAPSLISTCKAVFLSCTMPHKIKSTSYRNIFPPKRQVLLKQPALEDIILSLIYLNVDILRQPFRILFL